MFVTDLKKCDAIDITPSASEKGGKVTVRWLLGEPEGAPNFELRYFSLSGPAATEWHTHDWEHQVFVTGGRGTLRTDDGHHNLTPGCAVLVPPGAKHQFIAEGGKLDFVCVVPRGTRS